MCDSELISDKVKHFLNEIIIENGCNQHSKIEYGPGADLGEGYNSKTFTVYVSDEKKELHLFVKMHYGLSWHEYFDKLFGNEIYFYKTIYPAYQSFLRQHDIEDGFRNVPKCYGATADIIALENLSVKGYVTFDNQRVMDEEHTLLVIKALAKFHAISYAFKDQKKEIYNVFKDKLHSCLADINRCADFDKVLKAYIRKLIQSLDPIEDKFLIEACGKLEQILINALFDVQEYCNEYSIITQGDCWSNNLLFLYDECDPTVPKDVMLIDWQLLRHGSPAVDLSYFFYPMAAESTIEQLECYLQIYHKELSHRIKQLGSDPENLYPYSALKDDWKRFAKYGFAMAFIIIEGLLMDKDELPYFENETFAYNMKVDDEGNTEYIIPFMRNDKLFEARIRMILKHFVTHNLL